MAAAGAVIFLQSWYYHGLPPIKLKANYILLLFPGTINALLLEIVFCSFQYRPSNISKMITHASEIVQDLNYSRLKLITNIVPKQLIVLGQTLRSAGSTSLDLKKSTR